MAGGLVYTALESTSMATAEIYGKTLVKLGEQNPKIVALTADLKGSTKIGDFAAKFPERTINVGIAEQNMYGMAAGLAKCGFIPFASSFSVFASLRALDQIHTDICYQNVNVKIIGTHGGTSFGQAGSTHHAIEDFAVIRSLVNMTLICPADGIETGKAVEAAANTEGPFYIRINRGFDTNVYADDNYDFEVGKAVLLNEGNDITIIACGSCEASCRHFSCLRSTMRICVPVLSSSHARYMLMRLPPRMETSFTFCSGWPMPRSIFCSSAFVPTI